MTPTPLLTALKELERLKSKYGLDTEPNRLILEGLTQAEEILIKLAK